MFDRILNMSTGLAQKLFEKKIMQFILLEHFGVNLDFNKTTDLYQTAE